MEQKEMQGKSLAGMLIRFCLPLILSGILQQLYSWADAFILGNVEGETALAAVGSVGSSISLLTMAITGFSSGISVLAAQKFGGKAFDAIPKILILFSVLLGGIFTLLSAAGIGLTDGILRLLDTPAEMTVPAGEYLRIVLCGVPFLAVYNVFAAVIRGIGDSRIPFLAVLVSSLTNVLLDILFVAVLRKSVPGAAWATVISQAAMTLFLILYGFRKHTMLRVSGKISLYDREIFADGLRLGIPPMVQSCITSAGNMVLQGFMNGFGTQTVAAITTAYRVDSIILLPIINLASGISTITAQKFGAGDFPGTRKVLKTGLWMMCAISLALTALVVTIGGPMIGLFGVGKEAVEIGREFFRDLGMFYLVFGIAASFRGYMEGLGDVLFASIIGIATLLVRIFCSYLFRPLWGNMVIAWAEVISWVFLLLLLLCRTVRDLRIYNEKR